jgi:cellulose/xylan binding protein with CBM9 domain
VLREITTQHEKTIRGLTFILSHSLLGQQASHYTIYRAFSPIWIDVKLDEPAWQHAPVMNDFHFDWWTRGEKERTDARILWDGDHLYVSYFCRDKRISASVKRRHGPVSNDDCVEIFISRDPEKVTNYYTFEINVIGTMLNRCKTSW